MDEWNNKIDLNSSYFYGNAHVIGNPNGVERGVYLKEKLKACAISLFFPRTFSAVLAILFFFHYAVFTKSLNVL